MKMKDEEQAPVHIFYKKSVKRSKIKFLWKMTNWFDYSGISSVRFILYFSYLLFVDWI